MGSGQGARLCVCRCRQGLADTGWTSQLGASAASIGIGARLRRSVAGRDKGARGREPPVGGGCWSTLTCRTVPSSVGAWLVALGHVRDGCDRRPSCRGACARSGSTGPESPSRYQERRGGHSSHWRERHGEAAESDGARWRATGESFRPGRSSPRRSPQTSDHQVSGAAGLRPLRLGFARHRCGSMAPRDLWQGGSERPGPPA